MQYAVYIHVESGDLNDMQRFDDKMQVSSSFFFFNKGMQQDGSICQPGDRTTAKCVCIHRHHTKGIKSKCSEGPDSWRTIDGDRTRVWR